MKNIKFAQLIQSGSSMILTILIAFVLSVNGEDYDSLEHGVSSTNIKTNCSCGWANKDGGRIMNGRLTKEHEYPMMAGLVIHKQLVFCGGTIITKKHVITAAHCTVDKDPKIIGIHAGGNNYEKVKSRNQLFDVESFYEHPSFSMRHLKYDVSVVVIKKEFPFSKNIGPACLPNKRFNLEGKIVKVLGWGRTKSNGPTSPDLLQVHLDVTKHENCYYTNLMIEKFDKHQICTFRRNKDSCQGDSGGPLLWLDNDTNRYVLVASTSYGSGCGQNPALNSEMAYFLPFINKIIAQTSNEKICAKVV